MMIDLPTYLFQANTQVDMADFPLLIPCLPLSVENPGFLFNVSGLKKENGAMLRPFAQRNGTE